jgi:hypothetical protein
MTDSDIRTEEWKTWPGFSAYQVSHRSCWTRGEDGTVYLLAGGVRSVDRTGRDGRFREGAPMKTNVGSSGYPQLNLVRDDGKVCPVRVHVAVLAAHAGPCPPGMESSHLNDTPLDARWPENLAYEDKPTNERRKFDPDRAAGPVAKPVPPKNPKHCIRCRREFTGRGRRCEPCRVTMGKQATVLLRGGAKLEDVAAHLEYPPEATHALAVKYGGYGQPWSRRAMTTVRDKLRRAGRRRGGDRL